MRSKEAVKEDVERLREWLDKQPHLPHNVEHEFLKAFVCGTKTLEGAKRKLDGYYSNRNKAPKIYDEIGRGVNSQFREISRAVNMCYLTNPIPDGSRVFFISTNDCFDKVFNHWHEATRGLMMLELGMNNWPESNGFYLVADCAGVQASMVTKFSPATVAAFMNCYQDGYPIKLKGCFLINAHPFVEFLINSLVKPVMKAKLFNRIKVTKEGISFVKEFIPEVMLPSNYGGKEKSIEEINDYWLDQLAEKNDWFKITAEQASDERKRPPDSEHTYGIDGTFRKLAVD